ALAGCDRRTVQRLEAGHRRPSSAMVAALAHALAVPPGYAPAGRREQVEVLRVELAAAAGPSLVESTPGGARRRRRRLRKARLAANRVAVPVLRAQRGLRPVRQAAPRGARRRRRRGEEVPVSRRARRMRPATAAEQQQLREFAARVDELLAAPTADARREAYGRMRRLADRIRDPDSLANLTAAELHDALAERDTPSCALTHRNGHYGAPQTGHKGPDFGPVRGR
ncbi:helix-turn-helix domain-containing protein, partial [Micromonospora sp. ATA32]|nr:helix-turn-helix domain-containing protein [Micromonospora sp. ATA32]